MVEKYTRNTRITLENTIKTNQTSIFNFSIFSTHFDPKLCVFRCPSENLVDCPLLLMLLLLLLTRIELDLAGETLSEAIPDSKLQKLFAAFAMVVDTSRLFCDACFFCCCCFGGGSSFSDFLKIRIWKFKSRFIGNM